MTVIVKRIGGSFGVIIPRVIAAEAGLHEGFSLDVTRTAAGILFRSPTRRTRRSMASLARAIDPAVYTTRSAEFLSDVPVGREIA